MLGQSRPMHLGVPGLPGVDVSIRGPSLQAHLGQSSHGAAKEQSLTDPRATRRLHPKCIPVDASYRTATLQAAAEVG